MEAAIFGLINKLIEHGFISGLTIELASLTLLLLFYRYILKPMKHKIDNIPTIKEITEALLNVETHEKEHFDEIEELLKKLSNLLDELCDSEKTNTREITEIRRDITHVKQILNQFQGHMMYGSDRRTSDFGNKELR